MVVANEVFEKQPAFPAGLDLLDDLPRVELIIDAAERHAAEHGWGARWTHEAWHASGTVVTDKWEDLIDRVSRRALLSLHSVLVPEGEHYSTTPVFILRLETPEDPAPSRCWVRTRSETETLGLASRVEELLLADSSSADDQAQGVEGQGGASGERPGDTDSSFRAGRLLRRAAAFARGFLGA